MDKNIVDELIKHKIEKGSEGLLPQNLTDDMLERMIYEIISLENETIDTPASSLLMAITMLEKGDEYVVSENVEIAFEEEKIMEKFSLYTMAIGVEDMRRKKLILIPDHSLPTIENLFDSHREMGIIGFA